jgi:hypothetical protein
LRNISLPLHDLRISSDQRSLLKQCRLTEKHVCGGGISLARESLPAGRQGVFGWEIKYEKQY